MSVRRPRATLVEEDRWLLFNQFPVGVRAGASQCWPVLYSGERGCVVGLHAPDLTEMLGAIPQAHQSPAIIAVERGAQLVK